MVYLYYRRMREESQMAVWKQKSPAAGARLWLSMPEQAYAMPSSRLALSSVLRSSMAMVMGPTPPGTGVI